MRGTQQARSVWDQYMARIGRRGLVLFILAIQFGVYGIALITSSQDAMWWPVHQGILLGLPVSLWGIIWVAVSIFTLLGAPLDHDRAQFAVAAGLTSLWAFAAAHSTHYWGPTVVYTGLTLLILICSGWPDVRLKVQ
jgi:uncharacterized membrane protein